MDPPTADQTAEEGEEAPSKRPKSRTYRVEKFYGVDSGKWYYESEILTEGPIKLGWTMSTCSPDFELGGDDVSLEFIFCYVTQFLMNIVLLYNYLGFLGLQWLQ